MAALVTGGAGLVGFEATRMLAARGEEVVLADNRRPEQGLPPNVRYAPLDVSVSSEFAGLVQEVRPTCIYHFAALLTGVAERRHQSAFEVNVVGVYNLYEAARLAGVPRVVFVSSTGTYGRDLPDVIDDYSLQRPSTFYGSSKLLGENLARWYWDRFKLDVRSVRYPMIVAPGDRAPWHWIAPMIEDALAGTPHRCDQAFKGWSQHFMTIGDAARAAIKLSEAPATSIRTRCYTVLGVPRPVFAEELAAILIERFPGFSVEFPRGARPEKTRRFDDRYAREEWGWRPMAATVDAIIEDFKLRMNSSS
jgi:nucleoside-diphosphate-sugar epimerase